MKFLRERLAARMFAAAFTAFMLAFVIGYAADAQSSTNTEDGLSDAYALFQGEFTRFGFDQQYRMGYGFNPMLSTERLVRNNLTASGKAIFFFNEQRISATLDNVDPSGEFDLWFVKNVPGPGRNALPEPGDQLFRVGHFVTAANGAKSLDLNLGSAIDFDLDFIVVTRAGLSPMESRVLVGARTLFEKRLFRERAGRASPPVQGALSDEVETTDPLVRRGAQLFFHETFGGNGRTCGTCHRAENNLTIDPAFIAKLPATDPLFIAEHRAELGGLEDPVLLRQGLIKVDADGPDRGSVMRSPNHTFALMVTSGIDNAFGSFPFGPPDQRLGWSGDGSPGRGTLNEFALGAIVQHFPKTLQRQPGVDFRIPTQEEIDALEAFQLFTGRQKPVSVQVLGLTDARAEDGRALFLSRGQCSGCHFDMVGRASNLDIPNGADKRTPQLPHDDGFLTDITGGNDFDALGDEFFNIPPLVEAADTAPLFHNNSAANIEEAVAHYTTTFFNPGGGIPLTLDEQLHIAAFLRVINAAENIRQVRKRLIYVRDHRAPGNDIILDIALRDTQDALDVLGAKDLNPNARQALLTVKQTLLITKANADADRPPFVAHALTYLDVAKNDLFSKNPNGEF